MKQRWRDAIILALITGALSCIMSVLIAAAVSWTQEKQPSLVYAVSPTIPFPESGYAVALYQVSLRNQGTKQVKNVDCLITVSGAKIEDHRTLPIASVLGLISESPNEGSLQLHIPGLNPSEEMTLSVLARATGELPAQPEIYIRGDGLPPGVPSAQCAEARPRAIWLLIIGGISVIAVSVAVQRIQPLRFLK